MRLLVTDGKERYKTGTTNTGNKKRESSIQHNPNEKTTIIIFEEDIHDEYPMNLNPRDCPNDHSGSDRAKYFVKN
jgi:hypothetical protein